MNKNVALTQDKSKKDDSSWKKILIKYQQPALWRSIWQIVNSLVPYLVLWVLMYLSLAVSYWLVVPLAILAAGFLVRVFIIFHDCGHGSFFKSRQANDILGFLTGVLVFTPYYHWRWLHALHHASSGNLDRRGKGDIWTLTVQEYLESSRWKRFAYRLARNPVVLFLIAPLFLFIVGHRLAKSQAPLRERRSVYWTNLALAGWVAGLMGCFGIKAYLVIQLTVGGVAGAAGVWLFYVQHQFEGAYWQRSRDWNYIKAALEGSSFYRLPKVLQWFSGNIGFHHIHHLSARIPNYRLEDCHKAHPLFQSVKPVTLFSSFKSITFRLWDEQRQKLVGFGHVRRLYRQQNQEPA